MINLSFCANQHSTNIFHFLFYLKYLPEDKIESINDREILVKDIPFDQLVEKSFPLADINDAVEFALSHKPIRVMIKPWVYELFRQSRK